MAKIRKIKMEPRTREESIIPDIIVNNYATWEREHIQNEARKAEIEMLAYREYSNFIYEYFNKPKKAKKKCHLPEWF